MAAKRQGALHQFPEHRSATIAGVGPDTTARPLASGISFWQQVATARGNDVPRAPVATLLRQDTVAATQTPDRAIHRFRDIEVRDPFG